MRSSALELMGSGIGSVPFSGLLNAIHGVLDAAPAAGFTVATESVPLADVTSAWESCRRGRTDCVGPVTTDRS